MVTTAFNITINLQIENYLNQLIYANQAKGKWNTQTRIQDNNAIIIAEENRVVSMMQSFIQATCKLLCFTGENA